MVRHPEPTWADNHRFLATRRNEAGAVMAELLSRAEDRWLGHVVPRTAMFDLVFTIPGDRYPFTEQVRVRWSEGTCEFWLLAGSPPVIVTADRCPRPRALALLDAYLVRLVGDPTTADRR